MNIGDLVRILRSGTLGVVIGFDGDGDPIVRIFGWSECKDWPEVAPEFRHAVEVVNEHR